MHTAPLSVKMLHSATLLVLKWVAKDGKPEKNVMLWRLNENAWEYIRLVREKCMGRFATFTAITHKLLVGASETVLTYGDVLVADY